MRDVVIASGARTAIGSFGGTLKDVKVPRKKVYDGTQKWA
jgi:acetyl-CoA acetyltransferase